ncbi:response regulator transcription factor [Cohnella zeiphila]|uniref:Response regulator n=1 Tax=Cohnella zeiphila TaxID=2761120 RepID=A0A7X0SRT8_9BACL|nr:response regulator [Cohnella zeiphila]MBB6734786.1 response regulator [Cohnella zeiphila]
MYTLLIVEDENKTREALMEYVPWEKWGVSELLEAGNGQEALKIAREMEPDIVITDIRMPVMDGVELSGHLCTELPDTAIIMLSAYSELNYLKSAMRTKSVDYLLKPVDMAELEQAVQSAIRRIEESESRRRDRDVLDRNLPLLQEQFLLSLIGGEHEPDKELASLCASLGIPAEEDRRWQAVVFRFADEREGRMARLTPVVRKELKAALHHAFKAFDCRYVLTAWEPEWMVAVGEFPKTGTFPDLEDASIEFVKAARDYFGCQVTAKRSKAGEPLERIGESLKQMVKIGTAKPDAESPSERNAQLVEAIKTYIERHYADETMTVNDIAEGLSYTSAHLCMTFKKVTGITINHFANLLRIRKAKALLAETDMKIVEVALKVGYSNENYFSKVFRKYENVSPSEYKSGRASR